MAAESVELVPFGKDTGLRVTPIGFGGYRVGLDRDEHARALDRALSKGCSLIDTSTNYMDGDSETMIGQVLRNRTERGARPPTLVTKIGYVQGKNLHTAQTRESGGRPIPGMVKVQAGCWHCISPEFLEEQLTLSLERLGVQAVDAVLLHNPEYFLKKQAEPEEYYRRIRDAFAHLEAEAQKGRLKYYGISSNTFPSSEADDDHTSLDRVLRLAQEVSPDSRFRVIQFPLNLFETGAGTAKNNGGKTVLQRAREAGLATMANRPLNAITDERMLRLADFGSFPEGTTEDGLRDKLRMAVAEARVIEDAAPTGVPRERIAWAMAIEEYFHQVGDLLQWRDILAWRIGPALAALQERFEVAPPETRAWFERYRTATVAMLDSVSRWLEFRASQTSRRIADALDELAPELRSSDSLSRKVLRLYRSLPGMDCVLVGMRRPEYVDDVMDGDLGPIEPEVALRTLQELRQRWK